MLDLHYRIKIFFVALGAAILNLLRPSLVLCTIALIAGGFGIVAAERGERGAGRRIVVASLPFIAGFTVVFVALGAAAAALAGVVARTTQNEIAGFALVVIGLAFLGLIPWPERAIAPGLLQRARRGGSGVLLGGAFAVCAAPCIGTVLASILVLASSTGTVARGVVLLFAYSLGLGAAFVMAGVAFANAMQAFRWVRLRYDALRLVSGAVLVALGLLLFFHRDWWLRIALDELLAKVGLGTY